MSLATRCTHCGTIFKVVQDQLKVSEGWVRCGRCHEVFNALPSLFDLEKDPPPPKPAHLSGPPEAPPGSTQPQAPSPSQTAPAPAPEPAPQPPAATPVAATGTPIPLAAMPDLRQPAAAQPAPPRNPLAEQGLIADADVDLGFDSQPPSGWAKTQPASELPPHVLDEDDLALEPPPIEAATDFELDTSIAVDDNTPLEAVLASVAPKPHAPAARPPLPGAPIQTPVPPPAAASQLPEAAQPQAPAPLPPLSLRTAPSPGPWQDEPPAYDVPSTEEEDALDSRYLMPSPSRDRRPPRRLEDGPEFVDAQFPTDAFIDAEEDWASDFGPSALDADAPAPLSRPAQPSAGAVTPGMPDTRGASGQVSQPEDMADAQGMAGADDDSEAGSAAQRHEAAHPTEASDQPTFLKHARRKAFWRHPATRAMLTLLLLGLLATLALQVGHQFRDLIAAHHPASRPLLAQWCALAGCEIQPPLRIEDLQVESATLVRAASEGPDSYRLAVVVHNRSGIGLAWPHIDLTLTDENGAVIARRVFSPRDAQWLDTADAKPDTTTNGQGSAPAQPMPVDVPAQRSTTLQWRLLAADIKPAGYTAELFYP